MRPQIGTNRKLKSLSSCFYPYSSLASWESFLRHLKDFYLTPIWIFKSDQTFAALWATVAPSCNIGHWRWEPLARANSALTHQHHVGHGSVYESPPFSQMTARQYNFYFFQDWDILYVLNTYFSSSSSYHILNPRLCEMF